jgi:putative FmdB family regulatory protein
VTGPEASAASAIIDDMPTYAYRCRECTETFELNRPMSESSAPASCPEGHADTVKLLTTVALTGSAAQTPAPQPAGGGCCGGGCCG